MKKKPFNFQNPRVDLKTYLDTKECGELEPETMDPIGYFLIRINKGRLEVGLCHYHEINAIKKMWIGNKPQNIYRQIIKDLPKIRKDHCAYLGKELVRAWICLKTDTKYIQDGKVDGTFPEVASWKKRSIIELRC